MKIEVTSRKNQHEFSNLLVVTLLSFTLDMTVKLGYVNGAGRLPANSDVVSLVLLITSTSTQISEWNKTQCSTRPTQGQQAKSCTCHWPAADECLKTRKMATGTSESDSSQCPVSYIFC